MKVERCWPGQAVSREGRKGKTVGKEGRKEGMEGRDQLKEGSNQHLPIASFDPTISIITPSSKPPLKSAKNCFKDLKCKTKKSKVNIKNESHKHTSVEYYDCAVHYAAGRHDAVARMKPSFVCKREERISKRQEMFSKLTFNLDIFDSYLDELIDLEESFIA